MSCSLNSLKGVTRGGSRIPSIGATKRIVGVQTRAHTLLSKASIVGFGDMVWNGIPYIGTFQDPLT